jgi:hypothetical protein
MSNRDLLLQLNPEQDGANLESPDLDILLLNTVMDNIRGMSAAVQKTMLKSIITSLLDHSKPLYRSGNFEHCCKKTGTYVFANFFIKNMKQIFNLLCDIICIFMAKTM